jgi:lipopolysaccharide/colanic/teichoic acid biosynthesis glycosyltransferase
MVWKRALDVIISGVALLLGLPLFMIIAFAVVADSGFPILYRQSRVGREFRPFSLLKFRSMVINRAGPRVTAAGDARITRVGRILRVTKLDELPQLWNVLSGSMSLVGPRPEVPEYVKLFQERYRRILAIRPGITDLASIRFRNEETLLAMAPDPLQEYADTILPAKLCLAEEYIAKWSLLLDLSILWHTAAAIIHVVPSHKSHQTVRE